MSMPDLGESRRYIRIAGSIITKHPVVYEEGSVTANLWPRKGRDTFAPFLCPYISLLFHEVNLLLWPSVFYMGFIVLIVTN